MLIRDIVQQVLSRGYLTVSTENQLRHLLNHTQYDAEDFNAFINLQMAMITGKIRQQSWEQLYHPSSVKSRSIALCAREQVTGDAELGDGELI